MTGVPPRFIRHNKGSRRPRCWVYLDAEAWRTPVTAGEEQTFRLAVAGHECDSHELRGRHRSEEEVFDDTAALWAWITSRTRTNSRTVVVVHNLAYDLRVTAGLRHLADDGWELKLVKLDPGSAWAGFKKGSRSLLLVDSLSWLAKNLDHLGGLVDIPKPALPRDDDSREAWVIRCRADVAILRECWTRVLAFLDDEEAGNWRPTGAGQSWSHWRHRFYTHKVLVHGQDRPRELEREAAWAGRCEAWRHGDLGAGPWVEWDYTAAYAAIARDHDLPARMVRMSANLGFTAWDRWRRTWAVLSRVTVTTDRPTVPTSGPRGIVWPTGRFTTTLWDNEVAMAVSEGAQVEIGESWAYSTAPVLKAWAEWVMAWLEAPPGTVDEVARLVVKGWSRALIGRFGCRYSSWEPWGTAVDDDVKLWRAGDGDTGGRFRVLQLGTDLWRDTEMVDDPRGCPQVMSWVMAQSRCDLWGAMRAAGLENVAYVDTDSLIVDPAGHRRLQRAGIAGLRPKSTYRSLVVLGPRQIIANSRLRAAGVSSAAVQTGASTWETEIWDRLAGSLTRGQFDRVTVRKRRVQLTGVDNRRRHLADGETAPLEAPGGPESAWGPLPATSPATRTARPA